MLSTNTDDIQDKSVTIIIKRIVKLTWFNGFDYPR
jgi:hypothetical protein